MVDNSEIRAGLRSEAIVADVEPPSNKEQFLTLSITDVLRLPLNEFRRRFVAIVEELTIDYERHAMHVNDMGFIREGRDPRDLTRKCARSFWRIRHGSTQRDSAMPERAVWRTARAMIEGHGRDAAYRATSGPMRCSPRVT